MCKLLIKYIAYCTIIDKLFKRVQIVHLLCTSYPIMLQFKIEGLFRPVSLNDNIEWKIVFVKPQLKTEDDPQWKML